MQTNPALSASQTDSLLALHQSLVHFSIVDIALPTLYTRDQIAYRVWAAYSEVVAQGAEREVPKSQRQAVVRAARSIGKGAE